MSEQEDQQSPLPTGNDVGRKSTVIVGAVLVGVGIWITLNKLGVVSPDFDRVLSLVQAAGWGFVIVILGVIVIIGSRNHTEPRMPARGVKLYRSRTDRWIGGVLGGFGEYFGVDSTILRLSFIALTVAAGGSLIVAYIVMLAVMPEAPKEVPEL